ncbi:MAG TPA: hypothetical protein VFT98_13495 [Myxococcota bacterium]|nr:hypothetical protein [Myxococcota bacterium]
MSSPHPTAETLNALVDGELAAEEADREAAHVAACADCQREVARVSALKAALGELTRADEPSSAAFEARIRAALDRVDARRSEQRAPARRSRWLLAIASSAAAAVVLWIWASWRAELPDAMAAHARAASEAATAPEAAAGVAERLARGSLDFTPRVLDLRMLGWEVAGGGVAELAGRPAAEVVYRNAAGRTLLCAMLAARAAELPADAVRFVESGIAFFAFTRGEITVVAWAEGDVLCLLAGALPAQELRALAVAKAMLPAPPPGL